MPTQNLELFDPVHAVLFSCLSLTDFYGGLCDLYKIVYLHMSWGWEGISTLIRRWSSFAQLVKMIYSAWVMGNEDYYLPGHKAGDR
ncbi:MAG: hypothetical protein ACUVWV_04605 [Thermodesulfobacteriota bacterium]